MQLLLHVNIFIFYVYKVDSKKFGIKALLLLLYVYKAW